MKKPALGGLLGSSMEDTLWGMNPITVGWLLAAIIIAAWNARKR